MCETCRIVFKCGCIVWQYQHCTSNPLRATDQVKSPLTDAAKKIIVLPGHRGTILRSAAFIKSLDGLQFPLPDCKVKAFTAPFDTAKMNNLGQINRLCPECREKRRKTMNAIKPGTKEWAKRYDWQSWDKYGRPKVEDDGLTTDTSANSSTTPTSSPEQNKNRTIREGKETLRRGMSAFHRYGTVNIEADGNLQLDAYGSIQGHGAGEQLASCEVEDARRIEDTGGIEDEEDVSHLSDTKMASDIEDISGVQSWCGVA